MIEQLNRIREETSYNLASYPAQAPFPLFNADTPTFASKKNNEPVNFICLQ